MISIQIEEWKQLNAKIVHLQKQVAKLKSQNTYLKKIVLSSNQSDMQDLQISRVRYLNNRYREGTLQINDKLQCNSRDQSLSISSNMQMQKPLSIDLSEHKDPSLNDNSSQKNNNQKQKVQNSLEKMNLSSNSSQNGALTISRKGQKRKQIRQKQNKNSQPCQSQFSLLQEICIFGPPIFSLTNHIPSGTIQPCILYPQNGLQYLPYSNYFYPKKLRIRSTQKQKHIMEANKIIFKNTKNYQNNIFIFQGVQSHPLNQQNQIFYRVNPSKWLYAIVYEFSDFFMTKQKLPVKNSNHSFNQLKPQNQKSQQNQEKQQNQEQQRNSLQLQNELGSQQTEKHDKRSRCYTEPNLQVQTMYRCPFSLCIFTYFPLISFLQSLMCQIFDQVKLKRIHNFSLTQSLKDSDVTYFITQLKLTIKRVMQFFVNNKPNIDKFISFQINQTRIQLSFKDDDITQQLYGEWATKVAKIIDKQVFYQIYSLMMLQNSLFFICEDAKTLTYIIMLFASMLTQPFNYPYPVVSIIFNDQLLQNPFTSIVGVLQPISWLQKAYSQNLIDLQNKVIILISGTQLKVYPHSHVIPHSDKLKKLFSNLQKKPPNHSLKDLLFPRKQSLTNIQIPSQNQLFLNFFYQLQLFYHQNIFKYMPKKMIIKQLEKDICQDNKCVVRNLLVGKIQEFYKKANPNFKNDQFIKQFLKTEIFSICIMQEYQIQ